MRRVLLVGLCLCAATAVIADPTEQPGTSDSEWEYLSGHYTETALNFYMNQRGPIEKFRYVTRLSMSLEYMVASRGETDLVFVNPALIAGMGRSVAPYLPFAPIEMEYTIKSFWEGRRDNMLYRAGYEHTCFHIIHKAMDAWYAYGGASEFAPDVFYNRLFAGAGSRHSRRQLQREAYLSRKAPCRPADRLLWYVEGGYYVREIFGILDGNALAGDQEYQWDLAVTVGYPLVIRDHFALVLSNWTRLLIDTRGGTYWQDRAQLELLLGDNPVGTSFFLAGTPLDQHPRDAREGLLEIGGRFTF